MPTISGFGMINPDPEIMEYINSLTEQEKQTLQIAQEHLKTSFDVYKSIGFLKWKATQPSSQDAN